MKSNCLITNHSVRSSARSDKNAKTSEINALFRDRKMICLFFVSLVFIGSFIICGRIAQPEAYYNFADKRSYFNIPNFLNVLSNIAFLLVGIYGVQIFLKRNPSGYIHSLRFSYITFFIASILIAPGSSYFHWNPNGYTLVWDRLPMTIAFMGFFSIIAGEYINVEFGKKILVPLVLFGIFSVLWWRVTDNNNGGDLRLYFIVQFLPMLVIPIILLAYPAKLKPDSFVWLLLAMYALAKIFEVLDEPIFHATHFISGHTLKHLAAALGVFIYGCGLTKRHPVSY